ncbi:hypothetical protein [Natribacillus halophilus]|uniref:Uncharacterized protein n=1 Tax=Natribacillus halophilus TaxID=549003 RepID=A0A1G8SPY6_9BACI|nr:hypothetical protein [Natribacillus halophilus]SDJ30680.1 hypothetical protein SAMN04488123_1327 [Natribacillus halophilus]
MSVNALDMIMAVEEQANKLRHTATGERYIYLHAINAVMSEQRKTMDYDQADYMESFLFRKFRIEC